MSEVVSLTGLAAPPVVDVATVEPGRATGFVSITAAALYLGMGKRFVEELLATGELRSYKFGRARRIRLADLDEWAVRRQEA